MDRRYLPSKKIVVLVGVILLGGLTVFITQNQNNGGNLGGLEQATTTSEQLRQLDSDEDGLSDWQESLWGTDPQIADTDGDGTEDGAEVEAERNPNQAGPNDQLARINTDINNSEQAQTSTTAETNLTKRAGESFMPQAVILAAAQESGEEITDSDLSRIADSFQTQNLSSQAETYSEADLSVTNNSTEGVRREYVRGLMETLQAQTNPNQRGVLSVIATALQERQTEPLDLSPYLTQNQAAINGLLALSVPSVYIQSHIALVNSLAKIQTALKQMQRITTDPLGGVVAVQLYKQATVESNETARGLAEEINQSFNNE